MPRTSYLPTSDSSILEFAENAVIQLNTHDPSAVGVSTQQAADFAAATSAYATAYERTINGATRGPAATQTKRDAKAALLEILRPTIAIIQAHPGTTNTLRADFRITIPKTENTPIPVPVSTPIIHIDEVQGSTFKLRLTDSATPNRRAKPTGVAGATLLFHIGDAAPDTVEGWTFLGNFSKTDATFTAPPSVAPGSKIFFIGFWFNAKKQAGPPSSAVAGFTQFTEGGLQTLKIAA